MKITRKSLEGRRHFEDGILYQSRPQRKHKKGTARKREIQTRLNFLLAARQHKEKSIPFGKCGQRRNPMRLNPSPLENITQRSILVKLHLPRWASYACRILRAQTTLSTRSPSVTSSKRFLVQLLEAAQHPKSSKLDKSTMPNTSNYKLSAAASNCKYNGELIYFQNLSK